jgi:RNA polymerase sigma factor (sigma-70 family)
MNETDDLLPTRRTLLSRLKNLSDQDNWRLFFDTYWHLIYGMAIKSGLTHTEAQDVVQETVISVMNNLPGFHYDPQKGSFKSWLLQLTCWRITDQLRKRDPYLAGPAQPAETSTSTPIIQRQPDPAPSALEAVWDQEWEATLLQAAVERVKARVDPKQYQIFDLLYFKNWPVATVAESLEVNAAWVYLVKHRITKMLKKQVTRLRDKPI